jgi:hypothetical protein
MGTISDKLMRIINTKEDIRQALISKGYDVPTSIPFKEYAKMISDLPCRVDSFPDIEGIVARYSALGLTNEQMAANPVWVDKTGNGHDLQMKNFAWKEGSGISDIYPGALVFDGVDDYGVCDNFPILTKEKGYTVVALRQWLSPETKTINEVLLGNFKNNPIWVSVNLAAFQFEVKYNISKTVQTNSFGIGNKITLNNNHLFSYQISNSYNGSILSIGNGDGGNFFTVGCGGDQFYSNAAIWELVFLDHDATEEELAKIKDYFVKTYPWLFPDQAWTVTGKTNEDEDRATIANITGNGNDLVLSNFGFAEGSGYNEEGEYAGYLVTDGVDDKITSSAFEMGKDFTVVGEWRFIIDERKVAGLIKPPSFYLFNENNGLKLFINNTEKSSSLNTKSLKAICSDGRVYFDDWSEMLLSEEQPITSSSKDLSIGYNSTIYTQMAFKNLGIYNDQLLSKDDCIKAYNYLQTLKSK